MNKKNLILVSIFLATVIPTILVYYEHAIKEFEAHYEATSETKKTKTLGEGLLFLFIAESYLVLTIVIIIMPQFKTTYIIGIVGTVAIVILYYMRIYGIPVIGTDLTIVDLSTDWRDVVTKIAQQIMIIPLSMLLMDRIKKTVVNVYLKL